jgi:large subunit ribosomal protein L15
MKLNELSPAKGATKSRKRVGRGVGSGFGKTSGRGSKGQNSRSGGGVRAGFEGGQMPIHRRLPKRGFKNIFRKNYAIVNIANLIKFESGALVDENAIIEHKLISGKHDGIKLLGHGEINIPLNIEVHKASKKAIEKIEAAGGSVKTI